MYVLLHMRTILPIVLQEYTFVNVFLGSVTNIKSTKNAKFYIFKLDPGCTPLPIAVDGSNTENKFHTLCDDLM